MPMGAAVVPEIFQCFMDRTTDGLPHVRMYVNDAIIFGPDPASHVSAVSDYVHRLRLHDLKLGPEQACLGSASIDFLGHTTTPAGLQPAASKVTTLPQMLMPTDVSQLRSVLGGISCYRYFLPDLSKRLRPLNNLLKIPRTGCTPEMAVLIRAIRTELSNPLVFAFPGWDPAINGSRDF